VKRLDQIFKNIGQKAQRRADRSRSGRRALRNDALPSVDRVGKPARPRGLRHPAAANSR
jgi:hypothetical protein